MGAFSAEWGSLKIRCGAEDGVWAPRVGVTGVALRVGIATPFTHLHASVCKLRLPKADLDYETRFDHYWFYG